MNPSIHNTLSRRKEELVQKGGVFGIYCCGPTVYGPAHIGNFRTFLVQDVLRRTLECAGFNVRHVRNITDVDDKTIRESRKLGITLKEFTAKWEDKFHSDCKKLNMLPPTVEPRATEHIGEQLEMVSTLVAKGFAYPAKDGSVYDEINRQIAQVPPRANGVLFLPYLMGERSPWWDAQAKGAFLGLGPESTHSEILRAVMEGVCMNLGLILEVFREKRDFTALRIIGGGAKEPVWRQMLADVLRVRVEKLSLLEEGCSLGAAIVAGIGAGVFSDSTAIDKFLHVDGVSEPDAERTEQYARLLPRFQDAYERLKGFYG